MLGALGTVAFALSSSPLALALTAFVGMLNGMGRDRGAALVLEQAACCPRRRPMPAARSAIARYNAAVRTSAMRSARCWRRLPSLLAALGDATGRGGYRVALFLCAALLPRPGAALPALCARRHRDGRAARARPLSPRSRGLLIRLSALFGIDSLAGGFLDHHACSPTSSSRASPSPAVAIGLPVLRRAPAQRLLALGAAWLATRIGLVNTMVFTHIPSSLLLVTVAFAPSFGVAAVLFLLREGLVEMDVPTRQSYVLAVVRPEERTYRLGRHAPRAPGGWAVAPGFAGWLMQAGSLAGRS